jgi:hypothetical protein
MSAIAALLTRFNALEAKIAAQAEQLELISLMTPLQALNEGLKGADAEAKREFVRLMQEMVNEYADASEASEAKASKAPALSIKAPKGKKEKAEAAEEKPKKKRAATNATGPAAYNAKLRSVWREMVSAAIEEELPELPEVTGEAEVDAKAEEAYVAAFGALAKKVGISYRDAQKETAILQIMEQEGKERAEAEELFAGRKADEKAAKAAKAAGLPTPKATATPKPKAAKSAAPSAASSPKAAKKAAKAEEAAAASSTVLAAAAALSAGAYSPHTPAFCPPSPVAASSASAMPALTIKVPAEKAEPAAAKAEPAKAEPKAAAAKAKSEPPKPAAKVVKAEMSEEEREFKAGLLELGIVEKKIQGKVYYWDAESQEVYGPKKEGVFDLGEPIGLFDEESGEIVSNDE